ncbi:hypothetical protein DPMN_126835 [Dreissena polymorpha]|uniref:Uncharacterized protein n=1 Tax=Dreissena polymorpha TaxID=45954 RepID=A0A9D4JVY6_DREPO|nr:hypothetical protein DPMN_126835 [Dreissena polymorpha]
MSTATCNQTSDAKFHNSYRSHTKSHSSVPSHPLSTQGFLAASFWVMNEATSIAITTLAISQPSKSSFSTSNIFEG